MNNLTFFILNSNRLKVESFLSQDNESRKGWSLFPFRIIHRSKNSFSLTELFLWHGLNEMKRGLERKKKERERTGMVKWREENCNREREREMEMGSRRKEVDGKKWKEEKPSIYVKKRRKEGRRWRRRRRKKKGGKKRGMDLSHALPFISFSHIDFTSGLTEYQLFFVSAIFLHAVPNERKSKGIDI